MKHKLSAYRDGLTLVPFCKVCGQEGVLESANDCPGEFVEKDKKDIDKKLEQN